MNELYDDFHDSESSFDEILDFESVKFEQEKGRFVIPEDEEYFHRPLEEY